MDVELGSAPDRETTFYGGGGKKNKTTRPFSPCPPTLFIIYHHPLRPSPSPSKTPKLTTHLPQKRHTIADPVRVFSSKTCLGRSVSDTFGPQPHTPPWSCQNVGRPSKAQARSRPPRTARICSSSFLASGGGPRQALINVDNCCTPRVGPPLSWYLPVCRLPRHGPQKKRRKKRQNPPYRGMLYPSETGSGHRICRRPTGTGGD